MLLKDALDRQYFDAPIRLTLKYVPYARQDRPCGEREALSIKVFADLLNNLHFDTVVIYDPHSDVTPALINHCVVYDQWQIVTSSLFWRAIREGKLLVVAPDVGASKKVDQLGVPFIQGFKHRDTETGKLSGFSYPGDVEGKDLIIIDDICDGGGTFLGLADKLLKGGAENIDLYVTHGIFSAGLTALTAVFRNIWTTDSYNHGLEHSQLTII